MTTQFPAESAWEAFLANHSLDLEEEAEFREWLVDEHFSTQVSLAQLTTWYARFLTANEGDL